jgi:hypothetical protein
MTLSDYQIIAEIVALLLAAGGPFTASLFFGNAKRPLSFKMHTQAAS